MSVDINRNEVYINMEYISLQGYAQVVSSALSDFNR